jgi:DNA polymerase III subunit delta
MKTTLDALKSEWKAGRFAPVYLFYGEEDFLIEQMCDEILTKALLPEEKDFNLDIFYANEVDGVKVMNIASSYPLMSARRVVMVRNIELFTAANLQMINKYVQHPLDSTCMVLTAEKLEGRKTKLHDIQKASVYLEAKPLYDNHIPDWVRKWVSQYDLGISDEAIRLLQAHTGNALRSLAAEIDKLRLNLQNRRRIEENDVEQVVGNSKQFTVFELCDAVGAKNLNRSLNILSNMLQNGEQPTALLNMLSRHFFILAKLRELKVKNAGQEQIAKKLKIHPFFLQNFSRQAGLYNKDQLKSAFSHLLEADQNLKTSYQKPRLVLETLLFKLQYHIH